MITASKTPATEPNPDVQQPVNPTPPGPGPKPDGPTHPPGHPRYIDDAFDLALTLGPDVALEMARPPKDRPPSKPPRKPINTKPIRSAHKPPVVVTGKEPTPGSAAAARTAARESTGVVAGAGAASLSGGDRAGALTPRPGAASRLTLPAPSGAPRFVEGAHRLVGRVEAPPPARCVPGCPVDCCS